MDTKEWRKLVRSAKNNREYYKLRLCINGYINDNQRYIDSISKFIHFFHYRDVNEWYSNVYSFWLSKTK